MMGPMRPVIITANWKMNTSPADAGPLARSIADVTDVPAVIRVICPPYVALAAVREALAGTTVAVGAQNVHAEARGAYTGEVSAGHARRPRDLVHRGPFRAPP